MLTELQNNQIMWSLGSLKILKFKSCSWDLNLDFLVDRFYFLNFKIRSWEELNLLRVYTKKKGVGPNFSEPMICRSGSTVETSILKLNFNFSL
jgi:ribosome-interacting GTPase 1